MDERTDLGICVAADLLKFIQKMIDLPEIHKVFVDHTLDKLHKCIRLVCQDLIKLLICEIFGINGCLAKMFAVPIYPSQKLLCHCR